MPQEIIRTPLHQRVASAFGVLIVAGAALFFAVLGFGVIDQEWGLALFFLITAFIMGALGAYALRDGLAKWGFKAQLEAHAVRLALPANRSLIHRQPPFHGAIAYGDIAAIETRLEAYVSLGMAAMQRPYALRLRNGTLLLLGEDRALGSRVYQPGPAGRLAQALAARTGLTLRDLGMVRGKGGFLMMAGAAPDDWGAQNLPNDAQARLWRRTMWTGVLPGFIFGIAILIRMLFG